MWDKWWEPVPCSTMAQRYTDGIKNRAGRCLPCPRHLPCPQAALVTYYFFHRQKLSGFFGGLFSIIRAKEDKQAAPHKAPPSVLGALVLMLKAAPCSHGGSGNQFWAGHGAQRPWETCPTAPGDPALVTQCPKTPEGSCHLLSLAVHRGRTRCTKASPSKTSLRLVASPLVSPGEGHRVAAGTRAFGRRPAQPLPLADVAGDRHRNQDARSLPQHGDHRALLLSSGCLGEPEEEEEEEEDSAAAPCSWHQALCACPVVGLPSAL